MKLLFTIIFLISTTLLSAQQPPKSYCPKGDIIKRCREALVPYNYVNMSVNRIVYKRINHIKEMTIPLYYNARYRLVFNTELIPENIKIRIYSEPKFKRKRKPIAEFESSQKNFTFEPDINDDLIELYIDFLVPAYISDDGTSYIRGCLILMVGYDDEVSQSAGEHVDE